MLGLLEFLFSARGRTSRRDIWLKFLLPYVGFLVLGSVIDAFVFHVDGSQNGPAGWVVSIVYFWPTIAVVTKRFHDRNMTGWWQIGVLVPVLAGVMIVGEMASSVGYDQILTQPAALFGLAIAVGAVLAEFVILYVLQGGAGPNRFGADPLAPQPVTADVFG